MRRNLIVLAAGLVLAAGAVYLLTRDGDDSAPHLQADGAEWWFCSDACRVDLAAHLDRHRSEGRV